MSELATEPTAAEITAPAGSNAAVRKLESALLQLPQVDLKTSMLLHGGMAARTILIPAGVVLTGATTKKANLCIVVGDITVTTDDGPLRLTGFHVLPAGPGLKRAGVAHADTLWTTVWPTDAERIEDAENDMTDESDMLQTRRDGIEYDRRHELAGNAGERP